MIHSECVQDSKDLIRDVKLVSNRMLPRNSPRTETVLEELFVLLEDYAPTWYTKEHHDRAIAALLKRDL
jgi:hypothetical protein